jgi:hypothetical protein
MKGVKWFNAELDSLSEVLIQGVDEKLAGSLVIDLIISVIEG